MAASSYSKRVKKCTSMTSVGLTVNCKKRHIFFPKEEICMNKMGENGGFSFDKGAPRSQISNGWVFEGQLGPLSPQLNGRI
jgi:hypothetical protein